MLLDELDERWGVGAHQLAGLLAVLEDEECGHGADAVLLCQLGELVDVDLGVVHVGVLLGPLNDLGGNGLAGTAPCGKEVDEDGLVLVESGLELAAAESERG